MGVEESVTFYVEDNPVEAAHAEWETVRTANPYENLHFSYHYLSIIAELYQDITKYQFTFLDADSGEAYTGHYRILLPNGEITRKRTSSSVKIGGNTPFTLELENGEIVSLVSETCPDATTIQRTYLIIQNCGTARNILLPKQAPFVWSTPAPALTRIQPS